LQNLAYILKKDPSFVENICFKTFISIFLIHMGGGVKLGPLGTSATEWPAVLAPGDYNDGKFFEMKIGRGN
jgi:hypothetical protein